MFGSNRGHFLSQGCAHVYTYHGSGMTMRKVLVDSCTLSCMGMEDVQFIYSSEDEHKTSAWGSLDKTLE